MPRAIVRANLTLDLPEEVVDPIIKGIDDWGQQVKAIEEAVENDPSSYFDYIKYEEFEADL